MHCANAGAGQHGTYSLNAHGHVDRYAVALADTYAAQRGSIFLDQVEQLGIRDSPGLARVTVLIDQGSLGALSHLDLEIHGTVADIGLAPDIPFEGRVVMLEDPIPLPEPVQIVFGAERRLLPKALVVLLRLAVKSPHMRRQHARRFSLLSLRDIVLCHF